MKPTFLSQLRKTNREHLHSIWKLARAGTLDSLTDEEKSIARVMLEREEYHNQFEIADLLQDHDFDPQSEVNPFLHVVFHQVIETQLELRDPIEVFQFYNSMRQKKVSRHEAIHCIGTIFGHLLHDFFAHRAEFDLGKIPVYVEKVQE